MERWQMWAEFAGFSGGGKSVEVFTCSHSVNTTFLFNHSDEKVPPLR